MMLSILGLIETPGQYQELIRFAKLLSSSKTIRQLFLVYDCSQATSRVIAGIDQIGAECINAGGPAEDETRRRVLSATPPLLRAALRFFRDMFRGPLLLIAYRKLLRSRQINLVVVTEDSVAGRSRALVAAASRAGVPVLLVPFTIPNPYEAASTLGRRREYQVRGLFARVFAALRPNWVLTVADRRLLRLPLMQALMSELMRMAPVQPWIDNAGPATVAVESRAMAKHYCAMGLPDSQLALTGSAADHVLETSLRDRGDRQTELRSRFALHSGPLLLCALPPDQLSNGGAVGEFKDYATLIEAWTASLSKVADRFAIVVRPHPRHARPTLEPLQCAKLAICWDDTATLIPLCDLYVAAASATIRWAIACGRPVINYDVFQYRYDDYKGVPGVVSVNSLSAFNALLVEFAHRREKVAALALAQAAVSADWGCLDGQSERRILALAEKLLATTLRT
jgi:hypothetical protein